MRQSKGLEEVTAQQEIEEVGKTWNEISWLAQN